MEPCRFCTRSICTRHTMATCATGWSSRQVCRGTLNGVWVITAACWHLVLNWWMSLRASMRIVPRSTYALRLLKERRIPVLERPAMSPFVISFGFELEDLRRVGESIAPLRSAARRAWSSAAYTDEWPNHLMIHDRRLSEAADLLE